MDYCRYNMLIIIKMCGIGHRYEPGGHFEQQEGVGKACMARPRQGFFGSGMERGTLAVDRRKSRISCSFPWA